MDDESAARKVRIHGIVQGVGFRPFVYQTAVRHRLNGTVANTSTGVTIHIEGPSARIDNFLSELAHNQPPLAHVIEAHIEPADLNGHSDFTIVHSRTGEGPATLISPDVSTCDDCRRELFDPDDRRFQYPFINCTNCGPRYTIIDDIPYDRPKTSMRQFAMCAACQNEYDDPQSRRFHAQPNACADCGPHVSLRTHTGETVSTDDPIGEAVNILKQGRIIAVKGLGGFHLAVDAANDNAVRRLRRRKHREEKPFAVMSPGIQEVNTYAAIEPEEKTLLLSSRRPIVLLNKKEPNPLAESVAPGNRYFGVMLPYTPLHYLLLAHGFSALVMTSGNMTDEPIAIDNDDALKRLGNIAEFFLFHNRDIYLRSDDSIVRRTDGSNRFLRRSRGYVPMPVFLKTPVPPVLGCGAELKNTVCLTKGKNAFLSQHIGDLENLPTFEFFTLTIDHLKRILGIEPEWIAYDMHPDYLSTRYAEDQKRAEKIPIQHHHAHIVSCMAEHQIDGPVLGLSFDGTGFGMDGAIWGGEVLIADHAEFTRGAHLDYFPMPGSTSAITEPWRMAVSYLYGTFGEQMWALDLPLLAEIGETNLRIITQMIDRGINAPQTSSLGRLFDGIAAMVGIRSRVNFEGQAAMELEMQSAEGDDGIYGFRWSPGPVRRIDIRPLIREITGDITSGISRNLIGGKFHRTLIALFTQLAEDLRRETGLDRVVLSGGVFQNVWLLSGFIRSLERNRFTVYTHRVVPTNDGGISLGQAVAAAAIVRKGP